MRGRLASVRQSRTRPTTAIARTIGKDRKCAQSKISWGRTKMKTISAAIPGSANIRTRGRNDIRRSTPARLAAVLLRVFVLARARVPTAAADDHDHGERAGGTTERRQLGRRVTGL